MSPGHIVCRFILTIFILVPAIGFAQTMGDSVRTVSLTAPAPTNPDVQKAVPNFTPRLDRAASPGLKLAAATWCPSPGYQTCNNGGCYDSHAFCCQGFPQLNGVPACEGGVCCGVGCCGQNQACYNNLCYPTGHPEGPFSQPNPSGAQLAKPPAPVPVHQPPPPIITQPGPQPPTVLLPVPTVPPSTALVATFIVRTEDGYIDAVEFFSLTRPNTAWPGAPDNYYNLNVSWTYRLACQQGEVICLGAWRTINPDVVWGKGHGNLVCPNGFSVVCGSTVNVTLPYQIAPEPLTPPPPPPSLPPRAPAPRPSPGPDDVGPGCMIQGACNN
jgi:hypothetical protein